VPKTFHELLLTMQGLPAFAISFGLLFQIWWRHYRFFRRYDLEDSHVITMTGLLLFVVLFYVYPLKFLWSYLVLSLLGRAAPDMLPPDEVWALFAIYGLGVAAAFGILAALYRHAYARRSELDLTPLEIVDTRVDVYRNVALAGIGLLSVVVALAAKAFFPRQVGFAGFVYFLIGVSETTLGAYNGRLRKRLQP